MGHSPLLINPRSLIYPSPEIDYEVLVVAGIDRFVSSSLWIMLTGSLGTTTPIFLPANSLQFIFDVSGALVSPQ